VFGSTFAGRYTADNLGAVFCGSFGVEGAFFACNSLHDETSALVYEN
jgi:hypothetical protein